MGAGVLTDPPPLGEEPVGGEVGDDLIAWLVPCEGREVLAQPMGEVDVPPAVSTTPSRTRADSGSRGRGEGQRRPRCQCTPSHQEATAGEPLVRFVLVLVADNVSGSGEAHGSTPSERDS
jgi:hypothetical protein